MITLTFEPTCPEQAALLGKFLPEYMAAGELVVSGEPEQVKAVVEQAAEAVAAKKPKAAKPAATPAVTEAVTPAAPAPAAESPSEVTLEQVRAKLAALSQAGKAATVKELISGYGVAKLTDVPKDKYADLLAAAEGI
jgi:hypothetical protein